MLPFPLILGPPRATRYSSPDMGAIASPWPIGDAGNPWPPETPRCDEGNPGLYRLTAFGTEKRASPRFPSPTHPCGPGKPASNRSSPRCVVHSPLSVAGVYCLRPPGGGGGAESWRKPADPSGSRLQFWRVSSGILWQQQRRPRRQRLLHGVRQTPRSVSPAAPGKVAVCWGFGSSVPSIPTSPSQAGSWRRSAPSHLSPGDPPPSGGLPRSSSC